MRAQHPDPTVRDSDANYAGGKGRGPEEAQLFRERLRFFDLGHLIRAADAGDWDQVGDTLAKFFPKRRG